MRGNDLEGFRVLDAIDRSGTLAAAAAELNRTVASISYRLTQLEKRYQIDMVDRSGYRLSLSPAGRRLVTEARKLFAQGRYLDSVAENLVNNWEPELEVVIDGMLDPEIVLDVIRQIKTTESPTNFQLTTEYLGGVQTRFARGRADIMFSLQYAELDDVVNQHLFDIEVVLVAAPASGLETERSYRFDELEVLTEISVRDSGYDVPTPGRSMGGSNLFFVGDFYTKKRALLKGMGFGWMPRSWVEEELVSGALINVQYEAGSRDMYPVYVGTRSSQHPGRAQQYFVELMRSSFGN